MFRRKKRRILTLCNFKITDGRYIHVEVNREDEEYVDIWMFTPKDYSLIERLLKDGCRRNKVILEIDSTEKMQRRIKQLIREEVRKSETNSEE